MNIPVANQHPRTHNGGAPPNVKADRALDVSSSAKATTTTVRDQTTPAAFPPQDCPANSAATEGQEMPATDDLAIATHAGAGQLSRYETGPRPAGCDRRHPSHAPLQQAAVAHELQNELETQFMLAREFERSLDLSLIHI